MEYSGCTLMQLLMHFYQTKDIKLIEKVDRLHLFCFFGLIISSLVAFQARRENTPLLPVALIAGYLREKERAVSHQWWEETFCTVVLCQNTEKGHRNCPWPCLSFIVYVCIYFYPRFTSSGAAARLRQSAILRGRQTTQGPSSERKVRHYTTLLFL